MALQKVVQELTVLILSRIWTLYVLLVSILSLVLFLPKMSVTYDYKLCNYICVFFLIVFHAYVVRINNAQRLSTGKTWYPHAWWLHSQDSKNSTWKKITFRIHHKVCYNMYIENIKNLYTCTSNYSRNDAAPACP